MVAKRKRVAVVFGGRSGEHEVSILSAASVFQAANKELYELVPVGITKEGCWYVGGDPMAIITDGHMRLTESIPTTGESQPGTLLPQPGENSLVAIGEKTKQMLSPVDVVFPVLHGTYGEDGTIQGLLELADIPYVGAGVVASAVGMDKALMHAIFRDAGLPGVEFLVVKRYELEKQPQEVLKRIEAKLGFPCFVKPANLGSSVGISKVNSCSQLLPALQLAATYDRKIVVEASAGDVREIEVSVLGNDDPIVSIPGEIVPAGEFYDYKAKYLDDSELIVPARISPTAVQQVQQMAKQAFLACDCAGLARVDFFVRKDDEAVIVNEINTMPGFTRISMYPKLWEASGIPYSELIDRLINLALERHADKSRSTTSYEPM